MHKRYSGKKNILWNPVTVYSKIIRQYNRKVHIRIQIHIYLNTYTFYCWQGMQRLSIFILYKMVSHKMADRRTYVKTVYIIYAFVHSVPCWSHSLIQKQLTANYGYGRSLPNAKCRMVLPRHWPIEISFKAVVSTHLWQKHKTCQTYSNTQIISRLLRNG